jgi:hypothetical protein
MRAALPLTMALGLALTASAFRAPPYMLTTTRRYTTTPHMALAGALDRPLERWVRMRCCAVVLWLCMPPSCRL